jgi:hypothetical protein
MNIDYTDTLTELQGRIDISAIGAADASELISAADRALRADANAVLVDSDAVHTIWAWLENKGIKIFASLCDANILKTKDQRPKTKDVDYIGLITRINFVLKKGADGIVLQASDNLPELASAISPVRQDLFFGKKLIIDLDICEVRPLEWADVFNNLNKLGTDGIVFRKDNEGDTAGAAHGMLNSWGKDFNGAVYFDFRKFRDIEDAWRLICNMRPALKDRVRFFVK